MIVVRKERDLDKWPELHTIPESQLRQIERAELCACKGRIYQLVGDDVRDCVGAHNATPRHLAWRARLRAALKEAPDD